MILRREAGINRVVPRRNFAPEAARLQGLFAYQKRSCAMRNISITDITIRQSGKAAGYSLSFREKIELAKLLDRLGVSVIELHPIENEKIDSLLIRSVASAVKDSAGSVPV